MKFKEVLILLPCHSLEDFPLHYDGAEAENLLASWSAMWHPAFIASANAMPTWARADDPPEELADKLIVVPRVSESMLLAGWPARAKNEGACVLRKMDSRDEMVATALAALDDVPDNLNPELVADFHALGYAYLEEELLTRQMRYMSNLDEVHFSSETANAAQALMEGRHDETRTHLQSCFDLLAEARDRFYPAEAYLVDLTLVASTTLGPALREELDSDHPVNLLLTAEVLQQMADEQPEMLSALKAALEAERVTLVGGERGERELPLLPIEAVLDEFRHGLATFERILGQRPTIFGRRRYGITPLLPQVLVRFGYQGALHLALDEGSFPAGDQSKTRWEGFGGSGIDALTRVPLEADKAAPFLNYCERMGNVMDLDYVATLSFARWPGQGCPWYHDLRRIGRYSPVLGRFVTLAKYFSSTETTGHVAKYSADQYRSPYLRQAIIRKQPNPITRVAEEHRRRFLWEAASTAATLTAMLRMQAQPGPGEELKEAIRTAANEGDAANELTEQVAAAQHAAQAAFAEAMPRQQSAAVPGYLLVNPMSVARRVSVHLPELTTMPTVDGPVKAVQPEGKLAVVDVPALGYTWVTSGQGAPPPAPAGRWGKPKKEVPLGDLKDLMLRNEYFEVVLNGKTGGIQGVRDYNQRGARLSQQLAYRVPGPRPRVGEAWQDPDALAIYSQMVAEDIQLTSAGPVLGEMVSRGRLVDADGKRLAGYRQTVQVWRSSRVFFIEIELDIDEEPRAVPWDSYYASRFAWADESADMFRSVGLTRQSTDVKQIEAPYFVELRTEKHSTALLTGGLPYHRRTGMGVLDTLLVTRGESARRFRLGVGIDLPHPLPRALELLSPIVPIPQTAAPPAGPDTSWLFHLDRRNVLTTHFEPLEEEGRVVGFRARLIETEGHDVRCRLRSFRAAKSARQVDFLGQTLVQLPVEDDAILIDFTAYEWVEIEARF